MTTAYNVITNLVLVPVYLRYFSVETYGAWLASGGVVGMLGLVEGGISIVTGQRMATHAGSGDSQAFVRSTGTGWLLGLLCSLLVVVVGISLAPFAPYWVKTRPEDIAVMQTCFRLAAISAGLSLFQSYLFIYAYAWQRTFWFSLSSLISLVSALLVTLGCLNQGLGVVALAAGLVTRSAVAWSMACGFIFADWRERQLPKICVCRAELRLQLVTALPLFFSRTLSVAVSNGEPAIISWLLGPAAAATLAILAKPFNVAQTLVNPIIGGTAMGITHLAASSDQPRLLKALKEILHLSGVAAALLLGGALALSPAFVTLWLDGRVQGDVWLAVALWLSNILATRNNALGMVLPALGVIGRPALVGMAESILRIVGLCLLVPWLGLLGVPLASAASMLSVSMGFLSKLLQRRLRIPTASLIVLVTSGTEAWPFAGIVGFGMAFVFHSDSHVTWATLGLQATVSASLLLITVWAFSDYFRALIKRPASLLCLARKES